MCRVWFVWLVIDLIIHELGRDMWWGIEAGGGMVETRLAHK